MDPNDVIIPLKTQCLDNSKFLKKKKKRNGHGFNDGFQ